MEAREGSPKNNYLIRDVWIRNSLGFSAAKKKSEKIFIYVSKHGYRFWRFCLVYVRWGLPVHRWYNSLILICGGSASSVDWRVGGGFFYWEKMPFPVVFRDGFLWLWEKMLVEKNGCLSRVLYVFLCFYMFLLGVELCKFCFRRSSDHQGIPLQNPTYRGKARSQQQAQNVLWWYVLR